MQPALAIASLDALPDAISSWRPTLIVSIASLSRHMARLWPGPWLPMTFQGHEAMGTMGTAMGTGMVRMGLPSAPMGHGRPMVLPMPLHVTAMVDAFKSHGLPRGEGMGGHGQGMGRDGQDHWEGMGSHGARILIRCHASLGRSPAVAMVALMIMGLNARGTVEAVPMAVCVSTSRSSALTSISRLIFSMDSSLEMASATANPFGRCHEPA